MRGCAAGLGGPTGRSLRQRIGWRVRHHSRVLLLRVVGRPIRCASCGRPLFRVLPLISEGRLRVLGAAEPTVRVSFHDPETLVFRHLDLDLCPAPERPWVR